MAGRLVKLGLVLSQFNIVSLRPKSMLDSFNLKNNVSYDTDLRLF